MQYSKSFSLSQQLFNISTLRVIVGFLFIFTAAQVHIPIKPVPITMHTAAIMIISLCYNKREAMSSVMSFVILGAMGLPIFSGFSGGPDVMLGTTGGYILGCIACTYIITHLREKFGEGHYIYLVLYTIFGTMALYALGMLQLSYFTGWKNAFIYGVMPFIIPGFFKILFATASIRLIKNISCQKREKSNKIK